MVGHGERDGNAVDWRGVAVLLLRTPYIARVLIVQYEASFRLIHSAETCVSGLDGCKKQAQSLDANPLWPAIVCLPEQLFISWSVPADSILNEASCCSEQVERYLNLDHEHSCPEY